MRTHRSDDERFHARARVVRVLLDETGVDNVDDSVDGDGRLGDVGSEDDLSSTREERSASFPRRKRRLETHLASTLGRRLEDPSLHLGRQVGVNRTDHQFRDLVAQRSCRLFEVLLRRFNLVLALFGRAGRSARAASGEVKSKAQ